jgi:DNA-binding NtrC family response regulator
MSDLDLFGEEEEVRRKKKSGRILVVDDEHDVRESIKRFLTYEGYEVTTAESGAVAVERASAEPFDVVLTDLRMPGMSGLETLIALKRQQPDLPVILVTGYASAETVSQCMREGAFDYVNKPFELPDMLRLIQAAIDTRGGGLSP